MSINYIEVSSSICAFLLLHCCCCCCCCCCGSSYSYSRRRSKTSDFLRIMTRRGTWFQEEKEKIACLSNPILSNPILSANAFARLHIDSFILPTTSPTYLATRRAKNHNSENSNISSHEQSRRPYQLTLTTQIENLQKQTMFWRIAAFLPAPKSHPQKAVDGIGDEEK
ncbi:hypothetical protein CERZMDRAFT_88696 [Cercospora zeae-maydis SCOH1-5]|uniref:Uncharacterized protein n=1 Tax=Cercospora zeae-maydis SCOH1-5 TaxID=717836 RepID=A0A6A6F3J9_9PEZI|nr:hypothetical protein CERZMDRAFT_88696 [Cercospora zeae-maydis SCOH1-5]